MATGFKPYDLIWVEGKSAGWRYPSEIPAFKAVAPAIEEQPYDRFYKKQPPQKLFGLEEKAPGPSYIRAAEREAANNFSQPAPAQRLPINGTPAYERSVPSLPRHIHVTLPSGNTVNLTTLITKKEERLVKENPPADIPTGNAANNLHNAVFNKQQPVAAVNSRSNITNERFDPAFNSGTPSAGTGSAAVPAGRENYTAPLVEPATAPVAIHIKSNSKSNAGVSWAMLAAAFIGVATFVGLGIMIGLSISRDKHDLAFNEALRAREKAQLASPGTGTKQPSVTMPEAQLPAAEEQNRPNTSAPAKELVQNAVVKSTVLPETSNASKDENKPADKAPEEKNRGNASTEPPVRSKPAAPVNIEKSLSLTSNDFKTGAFGGITGLKYTLTNSSRYPLDLVEVEIEYIQANNKVYKTERLIFKDLPAGAQATLDAPSSNRGVKMNSRIIT